MSTRDTEESLNWLFDRIAAVDVAVRRWRGGKSSMLHPDQRSQQAELDRAGVDRLLPWLRFENSRGADVYARPARALSAAALVFLDDVTPAFAGRVAQKYSALAVLTSPGSAQVWIATDRALVERERLAVQRSIAAECHSDPGSVSGEHLGRMPGFTNRKPAHPGHPWVTVIAATDGAQLNPEPWLAHAGNGQPITGERMAAAGRSRGSAASDASAQDWHLVRRELEHGTAPEQVVEGVTARALARGKRSTAEACSEYARRTVQRAMHI